MINPSQSQSQPCPHLLPVAERPVVRVSLIAVHNLLELKDINTTELAIGAVRIALGLGAVGIMFRWSWFDGLLENQLRSMGASFEVYYAALNTKTKIRSIVLVTMLSLLLELVLIRWLASVFPVYSFYKNFTMLACFLASAPVTR